MYTHNAKTYCNNAAGDATVWADAEMVAEPRAAVARRTVELNFIVGG